MEQRVAQAEANIMALFKKSDFLIDRLTAIEELQKDIYNLTASVAKLATSVEYQVAELKELSARVGQVERKPSDRWEYTIKQIITVVISVAIGYLISKG